MSKICPSCISADMRKVGTVITGYHMASLMVMKSHLKLHRLLCTNVENVNT